MEKNLTPCKLWFLISCKKIKEMMCIFPKNNNNNNEENEDFRTRIKVFMLIALEKKIWSCKLNISLPSPPHSSLFKWSIPKTSQISKNGKVTRAMQTQKGLLIPFLSLHLSMLPRTFAKTVDSFLRERSVIFHLIKPSLNVCLRLEPFWKSLCDLDSKLIKQKHCLWSLFFMTKKLCQIMSAQRDHSKFRAGEVSN